MNEEKQRMAIAEACGTMRWSYALPEKCIGCDVPDYLNDLNACHDMDKGIISAGLAGSSVDVKYHKLLAQLCSNRPIWFATAKQRCEAFLKCLNLWKEDEG